MNVNRRFMCQVDALCELKSNIQLHLLYALHVELSVYFNSNNEIRLYNLYYLFKKKKNACVRQ